MELRKDGFIRTHSWRIFFAQVSPAILYIALVIVEISPQLDERICTNMRAVLSGILEKWR